MAPPDAKNPYRDELQAAQSRVAMLEEKLAAQGDDELDDDPELLELQDKRRAVLRSTHPRNAGGRAMTVGLLITTVASILIRSATAAMPHPNFGRALIVALGCGVCAAAFIFFTGVAAGPPALKNLDLKIAAARRRIEEARRLRSIERELRDARKAREELAAAPRARIAVDAEPEDDAEAEADEAVRPRRAGR